MFSLHLRCRLPMYVLPAITPPTPVPQPYIYNKEQGLKHRGRSWLGCGDPCNWQQLLKMENDIRI